MVAALPQEAPTGIAVAVAQHFIDAQVGTPYAPWLGTTGDGCTGWEALPMEACYEVGCLLA